MKQNKVLALCSGGALLFSGLLVLRAQEEIPTSPAEATAEAVVEHAECSFFMRRDKFKAARADSAAPEQYGRSALTDQVMKLISLAPAGKSAS